MRYGRSLCGDLAAGESREWLLTNGRGAYAMGTVAGTLTRRYHGLLVAAIDPPAERRLILARAEFDVTYDGVTYELSTNHWSSGTTAPRGFLLLESFDNEDSLPTWTYALGDALVAITYAMPAGVDAIAVVCRALRARTDLTVTARLLVTDRDHHGDSLPPLDGFVTTIVDGGAWIALPQTQRTLHVFAESAAATTASERYDGFVLPREAERGLPDVQSYAHVLSLAWQLRANQTVGFVASMDAAAVRDAESIVGMRRATARARASTMPTPLLGRLAIAADAFVVTRNLSPVEGTSIIAGYPWFADWGRDAMIALPGLLLGTGRAGDAAGVLRTFARFLTAGLIPNRFPDANGPVEYNTIDASLWFIEAVRAYVTVSRDADILLELYPVVTAIIDAYRAGTLFNIKVERDGLVRGGEVGVQLTWMDAKVGDRVITPRRGKPIEINALWYNALRACEGFAARLGRPADAYKTAADVCAASMQRYFNAERGWCYDVLDGPDGDDLTLRPNQIFAVSLAATAFDAKTTRAIVDVCAEQLWTSRGLRSLAPSDPAYVGTYGGDAATRDAAYHQGTAWPWLAGPFVRAHLRAYGNAALTRTFVTPLIDALDDDGLGSLSEIADGDAPHVARGCPAQAWSVGELIAVLRLLDAG